MDAALSNHRQHVSDITGVIGNIPYRMALAGAWIDQPFVSKYCTPPGSMVVVALEPAFRFMERCGMATSTRRVAMKYWGEQLPAGDPAELVRELYARENKNNLDPSGSQDMAGLVYPGVNRLDYDINYEGGFFPSHVESNNDPAVARWIEDIFYVVPINQRPAGYSPLGVKNMDPHWVERLSRSGKACYNALLDRDLKALGETMNECMLCWHALLPQTLEHPLLNLDLLELLAYYQKRYQGAMYSGCGGGYLYVASEEPVPGAFKVKVRISPQRSQ
jgi:hypothetical protein